MLSCYGTFRSGYLRGKETAEADDGGGTSRLSPYVNYQVIHMVFTGECVQCKFLLEKKYFQRFPHAEFAGTVIHGH